MKKTVLAFLMVLLYISAAFAGVFKDNSNGTVTDLTTNLMWQQCPAGLSGTGCTTGTVATYAWDGALAYCEGLSLGGFSDWRLPNISELASLVDDSQSSFPVTNVTYFPNTPSSYGYWSSTTFAPNTTSAWIVYFSNGSTGSYVKASTNYVRCVRGQ